MKISDYDWPTKYDKPFAHQKVTTKFLLAHKRAYLLSTMGTAKTLSALWACDILLAARKIKKVLIIAPLSILHAVWAIEIYQNMPNRRYVVVHGPKHQRLKKLQQDAHFFIINHDGIKVVEEELYGFDIIIIDEATAFKTYSPSKEERMSRTRVMKRIAEKAKAVWALSGSPTANSPLDAYGIAKVVTPDSPNTPQYYSHFRDQVATQFDEYTWIPKPGWQAIVRKVLSPAIRFKLEDCIDMPPMIVENREVGLSTKQSAAYKKMYKELVYEYKEGIITASNAAVKMQKLLQISCGVLYDSESGNRIDLPCKARENELINIFAEQDPQKLIVFTHFSAVVERLVKLFERKSISVDVIKGGVSPKRRASAIDSFQNGLLKVLIIQPQAAAHGLTLTAACTAVWYGPTTSNEIHTQANARIRRPSQTRTQVIVRISSSHVERRFFKALDNKERLSQTLLSLYKEPDWS